MALDIFRWKDLAMFPGGQALVTGEDAIAQAAVNCVTIDKGEVLNNPEFGGDLEPLLFEPIDDETAALIRLGFFSAITRWDPRILVTHDTLVEPFADDNKYEVDLVVLIVGFDEETERFAFRFNLFNRLD